MKRVRQVVDALGEFVDAVADGVETAAEIEAEIWNFGAPRGASSRMGGDVYLARAGWVEISPGVHARPTPRERIIRRRGA